jgi:hypothetical protein
MRKKNFVVPKLNDYCSNCMQIPQKPKYDVHKPLNMVYGGDTPILIGEKN